MSEDKEDQQEKRKTELSDDYTINQDYSRDSYLRGRTRNPNLLGNPEPELNIDSDALTEKISNQHTFNTDLDLGSSLLDKPEEVQDLRRSVETIDGNQSAILDRLRKIEDSVQPKTEQLEEELQEVEKIKSNVLDLEETASELVRSEAGSSIGSHFQDRKAALERMLEFWIFASFVS